MRIHWNKIKESFNNIHSLSGKIIIHGIQFATGLIIVAFILKYINMGNYSYSMSFNIYELVKISLVVFAEAVIGGILLDYYSKKSSS